MKKTVFKKQPIFSVEGFLKKRKIFYLLLFLGLVASLLLSLRMVLKKTVFVNRAAPLESPPPQEVRIANVSSAGFTVSWVTPMATTGSVFFATSKNTFQTSPGSLKTGYDIRGSGTVSLVHYVDLKNLSPNQKYFLVIRSGQVTFYKTISGTWEKIGFPEEQLTLPKISLNPNQPVSPLNTEGAYSLESGAWSDCVGTKGIVNKMCFRPNLIWGQVTDRYFQSLPETLVFLEIPGKSLLLSGLTDSKGRWAVNLANLPEKDLNGYATYNPEIDLARLTAQASPKNKSSLYVKIPEVFAENCLGLTPFDCRFPPADATNPVVLQINSLPASQLNQPISASSPTVTPTPTPAVSIKIKLQGVKQASWERNLSFRLEDPENHQVAFTSNLKIVSDNLGVYSGLADSFPAGEYDLVIKEASHLALKIPAYKIAPGNNLLDLTFSPLLAGDVNNDNVINVLDLGQLLGLFRNSLTKNQPADLNSDGTVNNQDLGILISNYRRSGN